MSFASYAADPPVPASKAKINLEQEQAEKLKLEKNAKALESELGNTRERLIKLSASIQSNEKNLEALETRMTELERERQTLEEGLLERRRSTAQLLLALQRLRRMPPEAMIAKPDAPVKTAQTALLLKDILPRLHHQAEKLKTDLTQLSVIVTDLENKRELATAAGKKLAEEQKNLAGLIDEKEDLYKRTAGDLEMQRERVANLSAQSQNLRDLVRRVEKDERPKKQEASIASSKKLLKLGKAQIPLAGVIRTRFNEPDMLGSASKGVSIEGRPGALVVAPIDGQVRFAGEFKNYGNLIILEHAEGYHSLIAGFDKIDTVVGHSVSAGEPLGRLHRGQNGETPALYFELRYKGKAINPAAKFSDLG
jgi:septal ring factor EnvC (AmiA/AmiB activator)